MSNLAAALQHVRPNMAADSSIINIHKILTQQNLEEYRREPAGDMEEEAHSIVIVGGGICGLATAIALHRKGIPSLVLEKSETLRADGVAIGIHANGWRALDQLGVAAELRETANRITAYHTVWLRDELRCLKRKDLIETLARNVPEGTIRFGCHIVAIHEDPGSHGAVITTGDGTVIRAKVLIGCDGTNSVVAKFLGLSVPKTLHQTVLRGFTRYPHGHQFEPEFLRLRDGDLFLGRLPVTDNLVYYFVTWPNPSTGCHQGPGSHEGSSAGEAARMPRRDHRDDQELRPGVPERVHQDLVPSPMAGHARHLPEGHRDGGGDAMHAMAPFIGQGGAAGLEDCVVLARSLSRAAATAATDGGSEPWEEAIAGYVRERRTRLALLSLETFAVGVLLRAKSPVTKLACFAVLALLGSQSLRHTNYDCGRL
ncbi:hypothetical protein ACP70R_035303 [Stipagrostis hirtigluma subsp. patula]